MNADKLCKDIEDLLPTGSAFILVVTADGERMEPTFVCNTDPNAAIEAMREIVAGADFRASMSRN